VRSEAFSIQSDHRYNDTAVLAKNYYNLSIII